MKSAILLLAVSAAVLSSCSTAYKTGQTPDDVYYSPARQLKENDNVEKEQKKDYTYSDEYYSDRYLWMKVRNRNRCNDLNDWYNYDRYSYGYNYYYGSTNNPYNSWNYYYNPYCCCHTNNYSYPKYATIKPIVKPHNFNLGGYTNTNYNNNNTNSNASGNRVYTNTNYNNSNGAGKTTRTIFDRNNNNNNSSSSSSSSTPSRTYTPSSSSPSSSSSSGSSSSGSSGGGSVTRPGRN